MYFTVQMPRKLNSGHGSLRTVRIIHVLDDTRRVVQFALRIADFLDHTKLEVGSL